MRNRNRVRDRGFLDLHLQLRAWANLLDPTVLLHQTETQDRGFIQRLRRHLNRMPDARGACEADRASLWYHFRAQYHIRFIFATTACLPLAAGAQPGDGQPYGGLNAGT